MLIRNQYALSRRDFYCKPGVLSDAVYQLSKDWVNATATPPTKYIYGTHDKYVDKKSALHRLGKPEEVASLIYFLCTAGASYVNGAEIHVNGGQHV